MKARSRSSENDRRCSLPAGPRRINSSRPPSTTTSPRTSRRRCTSSRATQWRPKVFDAGGIDENGVRRAPGGNPLTGPFYVEGAWPGDTLVVHLVKRLRLNRGTAGSGTGIVPSALGPWLFTQPENGRAFLRRVDHLDREHGVARLARPSEHMEGTIRCRSQADAGMHRRRTSPAAVVPVGLSQALGRQYGLSL